MNDRLKGFYNYLEGRRIAVLGIGMSNTPLVKMFLSKAGHVIACDRRSRDQLGSIAEELEKAGAELRLGDGYLNDLNVDIIFRTPGMKYNLPQLEKARRQGIVVTSEMEVFFDLCPGRILAVTGSDGKTTTTTLIAKMLQKQGYTIHVGGNIGHPLLPEIETVKPDDMAVVELSSFQLISMRKSPDIAVVTNVTPNHLDIHKDMEEYISAKRNVLLHQNAFSRTVLNLDNKTTAAMAEQTRGQCLMFSRRAKVEYGSYLSDNGDILMADTAGTHKVINQADIMIPGLHNVENYLAAIAATWGLVTPETVRDVARSFAGVEHRIEFVREIGGAKYYNDSIATSPTRTIAGLNSFREKVILIAGGYDKHIPFTALGPKVTEKVKYLILLGKTADKIEEAVRSAPDYSAETLPIIRVESLEQAVSAARNYARAGDIVTLSPACASFDMFKNFEQRGDAYKEIVNSLPA
ncbi:MAG TPA: UDP-N-acetylmuramoyl-L-alanine--D-glutamate ligase [Clostridia bacterium]|nr:UDP-N-acetylmuramoyl-L-alanine--D-glutamate ligase [Clostridia bacterium]